MGYFKLNSQKVNVTASYEFCLSVDHTLTELKYERLTGRSAKTGKRLKSVVIQNEIDISKEAIKNAIEDGNYKNISALVKELKLSDKKESKDDAILLLKIYLDDKD